MKMFAVLSASEPGGVKSNTCSGQLFVYVPNLGAVLLQAAYALINDPNLRLDSG